ncbi:MAG: M4 family metallopeptidase [Bacteroidota bacterium]
MASIKTKVLVLAAVFFICLKVSAQSPSYDTIRINKKNQLPLNFLFKAGHTNVPNGENMTSWFKSNLNANSDFKLILMNSAKDQSGMQHYRYQQYYKQIPVEGSMMHTHYKSNKIISMNGYYYPWLDVDITPVINENQALQLAKQKFGNVEFAWENKNEENLIKRIENNPHATNFPKAELVIISKNHSQLKDDFRLAYKFNIYVSQPLERENVFVDAINGEILFSETLLHTTERPASGYSKYNGIVNFTCDSLAPDTFYLRDYSRGNGIETYDANVKIKLDSSLQFYNDNTFWNLKNPAQDEVAIDIHWGIEKTYDFYKEVLGINSINDSGFRLIGLAHVGNNYNNANWNGRYASFGDGDGITYKPLTSLDVCGHEISHGLTGKTAKLIYKDESGGLNESFSDIFGKCIEHYAVPDSFSWDLARQIYVKGNYMRSMSNPHLKQHPKFYGGTFFITPGTNFDNGGVHVNSSIQNYWFYLLCNGGSGRRESDSESFLVSPIGWDKATQVAYLTLRDYLSPFSDFVEASEFSQIVAANLYGPESQITKQVQMAWYAVGLAEKPTGVVSVNTIKISSGVVLSPNPAGGVIHLSFNKPNDAIGKVSITDITGRKLLTIDQLSDNHTIDIGMLDAGMYLLTFEDGSCIKFVKN